MKKEWKKKIIAFGSGDSLKTKRYIVVHNDSNMEKKTVTDHPNNLESLPES